MLLNVFSVEYRRCENTCSDFVLLNKYLYKVSFVFTLIKSYVRRIKMCLPLSKVSGIKYRKQLYKYGF